MQAHINDGELVVNQAFGSLKVKGQADLTYGIAGAGNLDISEPIKASQL